MNTNSLIRNLNRFFKFLFWCALFFLMISLYNEVFSKNVKLGAVKGNHSVGYKIPARLNLTFYDSIVSYSSDEFNNTTYYKKGGKNLNKSLIDSLSSLHNTKRNVSKNEISIETHFEKENFRLTSSSIKTDMAIQVKSSKTWLNVLLFLYAYSSVIFGVLIIYFLKQIFSILNISVEFSLELFKKVKYLGLLMAVATLFMLFVSFIFSLYYETMTIASSINSALILNPTNVLIKPRLSFNVWMFIIGLVLIILSELLKRGDKLQQENDLTI